MRNLFSIGEDELGRGQVQIKWSPRGQHLAVAGSKRRVLVYNRNGELYSEIILPDQEMYHSSGGAARGTNPCTNLMVWDPTGARLLVLPRGNTFAIIWTASVREDQRIESSMKQQELTTAAWDKTGSQLAIGTSKGNLLMYSLQTRKITPFMGRHTRRITSIAWNVNNMVATTAEDQDLVVTDAISHREVLKTTLKQDPLDLQFSDRKEDGLQRTKQQNTLSLCHGHTSIYVHQLGTEEMPVELAFEASYGNIQTYFWYGDGYLLIGFVSGHVVVASSHMREMMEEVHSGNYLPGTLSHCAYSPGASQIAIVGKNNLRIMEVGSSYREVKSSAVDLAPGTVLDQVDWTADGQVLSVASRQGQVFSFLAMLPLVNASVGSCVAYLSSLSELSLVQLPNITAPSLPLPLPVEPAFIALCNTHVAVGINNKVWFYEYNLAQASTQLVLQRDYIGTVEGLAMSGSWAAVLTEGRATLHTLFPAQGHSAHDDDVRIPGPGEPSEVTCCKVNDRFLIIGTSKGVLRYYMLEGQAMVNDYKHREAGIQSIFPQPSGTLLIFEDTSRAVFLYNPVSDRLLPLPKFEATLDTVLWDSSHSNCFLVQGGEQWHCYAYHPASTKGAFISLVGSQPAVPQGHPCSLQYGQVFTQLANSTLSETVLDTHEHLRDPLPAKPGNELLQKRFDQAIHLGQLHAAWETALLLKRDKSYKQLAEAAMHHLDVELARSCWQLLGEASMVLSLDALRYVEDKNLLCGHILVLLGSDYHAAQGFFLRSSHPEAALEMWKDLKQWEEALKLVDQLSPDKRASLCQHYAQALELRGSFQEAHQYYKEAMSAEPPLDADTAQKLQDSCSAGLCRTTLHLGEIHRGRQMVLESRNSQLVLECAAILQHMNLLQDAAELYEKCERFEKAAQIYIQTKAFASAAPLMSKISSPKLHIQFAKARESEGHYREAAAAYEAAQEIESLTRVLLNHLREPQRAYALVRASGSRAAAALAAQHAEASQDWRSAIEFYLRAGQPQVAYSYAELHREMDVYAEHLDEATTPEEEYVRIAQYYANTAEPEKSAAMYEKCGMMHAAARMLLQNKTDRTVQKAIELVHRTNDKELAQLVMEHVDIQAHGDTHTFQLQMALGQYQAAASTAVSVARFEQGSGHYRLAHGKLFDAAQQLLQVMPELPQELRHALMLLHSYILVRSLLKLGNHSTAARLLVRVARNISKFPTHTVPILTSCVIECHRAGLMETALHYATMLMRPEHRSQIRAPYKKKLETMVRKREKGQDAPEAMMPCPTCGVPGPEMELECSNCQSIIPFCIATGTRMVVEEWAACPQCRFPCRQGPFQELVASDGVCPMCNQPVHPEAVTRSMHPTSRAKDHAFSPA